MKYLNVRHGQKPRRQATEDAFFWCHARARTYEAVPSYEPEAANRGDVSFALIGCRPTTRHSVELPPPLGAERSRQSEPTGAEETEPTGAEETEPMGAEGAEETEPTGAEETEPTGAEETEKHSRLQ
ncbi:hypothetical protein EYF80_014319 [Liparis tanakae]|uniref:Uncharacterized protein n=1 Tax=Liparis tanakae TaxID=230148 RepID=A0A4Z2IC00_9TELE|nr:hypothetical protein EYF80_014319 [Liparis tanakae]